MLDDAGASYRRALWNDQKTDVHVFVEKDAISGVIMPITERWDVPLGVLRGYASESFIWSMGQAVIAGVRRGRPAHIYQLGDHDPSGIDAWRHFSETVYRFVVDAFAPEWHEMLDSLVLFERLAVNPWQIDLYDLPTRPTKQSDSRARGFVGESVEVDAIPPTLLREILDEAITRHVDREALRLTEIAEASEREVFTAMRGRS